MLLYFENSVTQYSTEISKCYDSETLLEFYPGYDDVHPQNAKHVFVAFMTQIIFESAIRLLCM